MIIRSKGTKAVFSFLMVLILVFGSASSVFAANSGSGSYSFSTQYEIPLPQAKNTPSVNVTTKPTTTSDAQLIIYLWKKNSSGNWVEVAHSWNSGSVEDTCALNPSSTGAGTYKIVIKSAGNASVNTGTYSYTDWNN